MQNESICFFTQWLLESFPFHPTVDTCLWIDW